ncbi:MAG: hypothetical protein GYB64_14425 [Chloroflexi bacterium]|nr:hypothetical protein [Chloroflexota bacterium]
MPFAAEPETLASDQRIAVSLPGGGTQEVGLFPAQGLPDGTLLMAARDSAFAYGLSVIYEPESGGLFRVTRADTGEPVRVVDVQNGEALFLPEDVGAQAPLFRGQLDPAGRLEAVEQVASAGAVPDRAAMLPDAVVASVRGALVRITPDERTLLLEGVDSGFAVLGPETIIVPVPEGETVVLVTLSVDGGEPALLAEGNYPLVVP